MKTKCFQKTNTHTHNEFYILLTHIQRHTSILYK